MWEVLDRTRGVSTKSRDSSMSQDGLFTARIVGIYRIYAVAIINGTATESAGAIVTVLGQLEFFS